MESGKPVKGLTKEPNRHIGCDSVKHEQTEHNEDSVYTWIKQEQSEDIKCESVKQDMQMETTYLHMCDVIKH